jgi:hypothetical protein
MVKTGKTPMRSFGMTGLEIFFQKFVFHEFPSEPVTYVQIFRSFPHPIFPE